MVYIVNKSVGQFDILGEYFQVSIKTRCPKNKAKILKDSKSRGPHDMSLMSSILSELLYTLCPQKNFKFVFWP